MQLFPGYRSMGLSRIQACTEIYNWRGQYELSENHARSEQKIGMLRGSSARSEAPSVSSAPDLCIWASGPEKRSEVKKIIRQYCRKHSPEKGQSALVVVLMEFWGRLSKWSWALYGLNCGFSNGTLAGRLQACMYVSNTRCWISCVPCKHITNDIIVPDDCQYVRWFQARNIPFHLFDGGGTSLWMEAKGQLCSEGPLECCGRCEVRIHGSYCLKCRTYELPSPTLRRCKTVQPTLNVMSANGNTSLRVPCPLVKCEEGSLCPHAV